MKIKEASPGGFYTGFHLDNGHHYVFKLKEKTETMEAEFYIYYKPDGSNLGGGLGGGFSFLSKVEQATEEQIEKLYKWVRENTESKDLYYHMSPLIFN